MHGRSSAPVHVVFMHLFMVYRRRCCIQYRMVGMMNFRGPREKRAWPNLDNRHLTQGSAENRKKPQVDRCSGGDSSERKQPRRYLKLYPSSQLKGLRENPRKRQSRSLVSRPRVETGHPEYRIGMLRA